MATSVKATPQTIFNGINDQSTVTQENPADLIPTHLPKCFVYTKWGPTTPELVVGASLTNTYHADSFDLRKKWANHQTVLLNKINAQGNSIMVQRLKPADAADEAMVRISLDILETDLPVYQRGTDGTYLLDVNGDKQQVGTTVIAGVKLKWVATAITAATNFGLGAQSVGDQTDGTNQSIRIPIMDLKVPHFGENGNNYGIRMWAATGTGTDPLDTSILTNESVYPFNISCFYRATTTSTPSIVKTIDGQESVQVTWKTGVINSNNDSQLSFDDVFVSSYQDLTSATTAPTYGPFGEAYLYQTNLTTALTTVYNKEAPAVDSFSDFTGTSLSTEMYLVNLLSAVSTQNSPYHAVELVSTGTGAFLPNQSSTIYARGGTDGTMSDALYAGLVSTAMADYADENSELMDMANNPESVIYDTGFPLATKKDLTKFISVRKDTFVFLSTHIVGGATMTASEETSMAIALKAAAQLYPESSVFGTAPCRAAIIGRSGKLISSQYTGRLPLTVELGEKLAAYMGAGTGIWDSTAKVDMQPNNQISTFSDVNVTFTPITVRNKDWDNGLVWVQKISRKVLFWPALKTVYDNDTSVLNSIVTVLVCCDLQKVGYKAWTQYSGRRDLTPSQLCERVNDYITTNAKGRYGDEYIVTPNAYITSGDNANGFSWTTEIELRSPVMSTVQKLTVIARRRTDTTTS